ncbi:MAG TPA: SRPBCC domain-containing protein [Phycisphaerales bacterium]|nr:SRPBCC domain-containing protein [Phycisphaerales bacterium]
MKRMAWLVMAAGVIGVVFSGAAPARGGDAKSANGSAAAGNGGSGVATLPSTVVDAERVIRAEVIVQAPVAEVWKAWTTSEGVKSFLERPCEIDCRVGGKYEIYFGGDEAPAGLRGSEGCTVLAYAPERMVSFTWNAPPKFASVRNGAERTMVVVEMRPITAMHTKVTLVHHGWPRKDASLANIDEWNGTFEYFKNAWPSVMKALGERFKPKEGEACDYSAGWVYMIVDLSRPDLIQTLTEEEKKILGAHAAYIRDQSLAGVVTAAGPCTDGKGPGIVVFHAKDEASARAIMEGDPAVKNGLFKTELHPMRLAFVSGRDAN